MRSRNRDMPGRLPKRAVAASIGMLIRMSAAVNALPAAASLTWLLELLTEDVGSLSLPLDGWRIDATMTAAHGGYINQSSMLWGPGEVPVAMGRQTMVVFG